GTKERVITHSVSGGVTARIEESFCLIDTDVRGVVPESLSDRDASVPPILNSEDVSVLVFLSKPGELHSVLTVRHKLFEEVRLHPVIGVNNCVVTRRRSC